MPGGSQGVDPVNIDSFSRSPKAFASGSRIPKTSPHSFDYRLPLAFRYCCKNVKDECACWSRRINLLDHRHKIDLESVERVQRTAQV
jgi:hypothetical protein